MSYVGSKYGKLVQKQSITETYTSVRTFTSCSTNFLSILAKKKSHFLYFSYSLFQSTYIQLSVLAIYFHYHLNILSQEFI
jgi:hypothetical protein